MRFLVVLAAAGWIGCGMIAAAGWNAWTQENLHLGCGQKARMENAWESYIVIPVGPLAMFAVATATGGFDEGLDLTACGSGHCTCMESKP